MSAKHSKAVRRISRLYYDARVRVWLSEEPPRLCFLRHARWKKREPIYRDIEKQIKKKYR